MKYIDDPVFGRVIDAREDDSFTTEELRECSTGQMMLLEDGVGSFDPRLRKAAHYQSVGSFLALIDACCDDLDV